MKVNVLSGVLDTIFGQHFELKPKPIVRIENNRCYGIK